MDALCGIDDKRLILNDKLRINQSGGPVDKVVDDDGVWLAGGANTAEIG